MGQHHSEDGRCLRVDEVFKDNLRPFSIQDWVKDCMLIDVEPALSNLIGRLEDAKKDVD